MYIPAAFAETDLTKLHDLIVQNSFGLLISSVADDPIATHLPFLLERQTGKLGTLVCHTARANPHWESLANQQALAIFSGPHAYISPTWYEADHVVPTWNYLAVHAYGRAQIIHDKTELLKIVSTMVTTYEQNMPQPWPLDESSAYVDKLLAQIVGIRIEIESIEGKWKVNQNQPADRRQKVVRALQERGDENSLAVAESISQTLPPTPPP